MKQDTQGDDQGYGEFTKDIDGLVFGRGTYETVLGFDEWPYAKPVVVLSRSLSQSDVPPSLTGKVEISALEPVELMKRLEKAGWSRVYVDGGQVVQSFIRLGLVEDIILTTIPILIGDGIRLFGKLETDIDLELLGSKTLNSGLVQSHYRLKKPRSVTQDGLGSESRFRRSQR